MSKKKNMKAQADVTPENILPKPKPADLAGDSLSPEEIDLLLKNINSYSKAEATEILENLEALEERNTIDGAYNDLIAFCCYMQEDYIVGKHHRILADLFMELEGGLTEHEDGTTTGKDRAAVNMPPRHGKSILTSLYYPAWYLGRNPTKKVMMVSHTTDLAVDFGRKVRNLISSPKFQKIFPNVGLSSDSKSAGRWNTSAGGEYYACGIGSSIAGRGADLLIIDDPHSEQDVINGNFGVFEKAYEWFTYGARTRLMPKGRVAVVQTRWHMDDLTGRLVRDMATNDEADTYHVVEFPAVFEIPEDYYVTVEEQADEDGFMQPVEIEVSPDSPIPISALKKSRIKEKPLWPEFFTLAALHRTKASMPLFQWNSQYQQHPTAEEAAIIKREYWREWQEEEPPTCEYVIVTLDAAAEKNNRADYTGITRWGVFMNEEEEAYNIILLDVIQERLEFPELKKRAKEIYADEQPDAFIVEKKSNGTPLYQEMRRMGIPVTDYTPHRGSGDKIARLNSVADIVLSGICWVPRTRWAEVLVDEVAAFPFGSNDDLVDCTIMALMRFRQGGFIRLPSDEAEEQRYFKRRTGGYY